MATLSSFLPVLSSIQDIALTPAEKGRDNLGAFDGPQIAGQVFSLLISSLLSFKVLFCFLKIALWRGTIRSFSYHLISKSL